MASLMEMLQGALSTAQTPAGALTANPLLMAKLSNQRQAIPRQDISQQMNYPQDWGQFGTNLAQQFPIDTPENVRAAAQRLAMNIGPQSIAGKLNKLLTEDQFLDKYYRHIDLRGRGGNPETTLQTVLNEGFNRGIGPNALPMFKTPSAMEQRFPIKDGDFVYLVPRKFIDSTGNGPRIKNGWVPEPNEVVKVTDANRSLYEYFVEASKGSGRVEK